MKLTAGQGFAHEDRKPSLDLVEPGGVIGDETKMNGLVAGESAIVFGFVGTKIIKDDMRLAITIPVSQM